MTELPDSIERRDWRRVLAHQIKKGDTLKGSGKVLLIHKKNGRLGLQTDHRQKPLTWFQPTDKVRAFVVINDEEEDAPADSA